MLVRHRAFLVALAFLAGLLVPIVTTPPALGANGTLAGTVTNPGGAPTSGFRVDAYSRATPTSPWAISRSGYFSDWSPGLVAGTFSLAVPAGTYRVCVFASTYTIGYECWNEAIRAGSGDDVTVTGGGTSTVQIQLRESAAVSGRITAPDGSPIRDVYVTAEYLDESTGQWSSAFGYNEQHMSSDAGGDYEVAGLTPGTYRICAHPPDGTYVDRCWLNAPTPDTADDVTLAPGSTTNGINLQLASRGRIAGAVTTADGLAVSASARAYKFNAATSTWSPAATAPVNSGDYEIPGLDAGTYRVCFEASSNHVSECWNDVARVADATDVPVGNGQTVTGIDAQLGAGGVIAGTIHDAYTGAQGAIQVDVYRQDGGAWQTVSGTTIETAAPNADYEVTGLPTGTYRVCFWHSDPEFVPGFAPECVGGSPTAATGDDVLVTQGQVTTGVDVDLDPPGLLRGRVRGTTLSVPVQLYTASGKLIFERRTGVEGRYAFVDLPSGAYKLAFNRKSSGTRRAAEFYRDLAEGMGLANATAVAVNGTGVTGIGARLDPGGSITGRVVGPDGAGLASCRVRAYTVGRVLVTRLNRTDASGAFDVGGLSTGAYRLRIDGGTCALGAQDLYYDAASPTRLSPQRAAADRVAVTRGAATALPRPLGETF